MSERENPDNESSEEIAAENHVDLENMPEGFEYIEKLVEELEVERDPSRAPVFQVLYFHHATVPAHDTDAAGLAKLMDSRPLSEHSPLAAIDPGAAKFDLMAATVEMEDGAVSGMLEYATDLFDTATMERFARQLATLLEAAAAAPDRPLRELPLMDGEERKQVASWSAAPPRIADMS